MNGKKVSQEEHLHHLGDAIQHYFDQHGDCDQWDEQEWRWHDLLVERVNEEDGWSDSEGSS